MFGLFNEDGIDMVKLQESVMLHEGIKLKPYTDITGNLTIGYGRNLTGKGISNAEAADMLDHDLRDVIEEARGEAFWPHVINNDARVRACIEIIYNIGLGTFRGFKDAIACLLNDDFDGAATAFLDSRWAKQVGKRSITLTNMIRTGHD